MLPPYYLLHEYNPYPRDWFTQPYQPLPSLHKADKPWICPNCGMSNAPWKETCCKKASQPYS